MLRPAASDTARTAGFRAGESGEGGGGRTQREGDLELWVGDALGAMAPFGDDEREREQGNNTGMAGRMRASKWEGREGGRGEGRLGGE